MTVVAMLALGVLHLLAQVGVVVSAPAEVRGGDRAVVTVEVRAPAAARRAAAAWADAGLAQYG